MGTLRLLEQLADIVLGAFLKSFTLEQLGIAENCGERIVQFVRYSGN